MFEGKPVRADFEQSFDQSNGDGGDLRRVTWPELVARLDAARDLRTVLGDQQAGGDASFDLASARHIAELGEGKHGVNLDGLANGKGPSGISGQTEQRGSDSVRGK